MKSYLISHVFFYNPDISNSQRKKNIVLTILKLLQCLGISLLLPNNIMYFRILLREKNCLVSNSVKTLVLCFFGKKYNTIYWYQYWSPPIFFFNLLKQWVIIFCPYLSSKTPICIFIICTYSNTFCNFEFSPQLHDFPRLYSAYQFTWFVCLIFRIIPYL